MQSKVNVMGHPVHPILVPFPLGLLTTSVIFDVVHLFTGGARWEEITFWMIAVGVVGGLIAAVFGVIDWLAIPSGTRAKAVGLGHGLSNVLMVALFVSSWLLRAGPGPRVSCPSSCPSWGWVSPRSEASSGVSWSSGWA